MERIVLAVGGSRNLGSETPSPAELEKLHVEWLPGGAARRVFAPAESPHP